MFAGCCPVPEPTFTQLLQSDTARKRLLSMARNMSPIDTVANVVLLPRTVLPRILKHWVSWCVILTYIIIAALCRHEIALVYDDVDSDVMNGLDVSITFST